MIVSHELWGIITMWTERIKIITTFDEALVYIESQNGFHDFRLGNIEVRKNTVKIMIEEDTGNKHNKNAHIWDFSFTDISDLNFDMDCVLATYITEVEIEDQLIYFNLSNGYISFLAQGISLGIPTP